MSVYDEAVAILRRDHRGAPGGAPGWDSLWSCSCGASGGGWGTTDRARDWQKGYRQHLRAAHKSILADLRGESR